MNYDQKAVKIKGREYAQKTLLIPPDNVEMIRLIEKVYTAGYRQRILDVRNESKEALKEALKEAKKVRAKANKALADAKNVRARAKIEAREAVAEAKKEAMEKCDRSIEAKKETIARLKTEIKSIQARRMVALGVVGRKKKEVRS